MVVVTPALTVRAVTGLHQVLLSGAALQAPLADLNAGAAVGFNSIARGCVYSAALARDRVLIVADRPLDVAEGWNAAQAFGATVVSDAYQVFEIAGPAVNELVALATTLAPEDETRSAVLLFASVSCIAYRHESTDRIRVHVANAFAAYLFDWLQQSVAELTGGAI
jgi:sarcosine oxidase gamma subunit